jgi:hypothetical protein
VAADEVLLRAAAWLSLIAWALGEWWRSSAALSRARLAWTLGAGALLAHTVLAFHVRHFWSHGHASREIARRTEAVVGLDWEGGIWVNYAFDALWVSEALWWWLAAASFLSRPRALVWVSRFVFLTMFLNGAVVFAHGPNVPVGVLAIVLVLWAWLREGVARRATP